MYAVRNGTLTILLSSTQHTLINKYGNTHTAGWNRDRTVQCLKTALSGVKTGIFDAVVVRKYSRNRSYTGHT